MPHIRNMFRPTIFEYKLLTVASLSLFGNRVELFSEFLQQEKKTAHLIEKISNKRLSWESLRRDYGQLLILFSISNGYSIILTLLFFIFPYLHTPSHEIPNNVIIITKVCLKVIKLLYFTSERFI